MLNLLLALALVQESPFDFKGTGWVNSKELHAERLRGKVVALYFFEEG